MTCYYLYIYWLLLVCFYGLLGRGTSTGTGVGSIKSRNKLCPSLTDFPSSSNDVHKHFVRVSRLQKNQNTIETKQVGLSGLGNPLYVYTITLPHSALDLDFNLQTEKLAHGKINSTFLFTKSCNHVHTDPLHLLLIGGLHSREWISVSSVLCIALHYSSVQSTQPVGISSSGQGQRKFVFHFWPVLNADGYDYSHSAVPKSRHWRKTHPLSNTSKNGVDLNRNFGIENISWGFGSKTNHLSELYQGEKPFSESESMALRRFIKSLPVNSIVLDIHCCARVVFPAIDIKSMRSKQESIQAAIYVANKMSMKTPAFVLNKYKYRQRESNFSKSNTGIAVDWIDAQTNIKYAFMLEIRGKRNPANFRDLFRNPPSDIQPLAEEVEAGIRGIIEFTLGKNYGNTHQQSISDCVHCEGKTSKALNEPNEISTQIDIKVDETKKVVYMDKKLDGMSTKSGITLNETNKYVMPDDHPLSPASKQAAAWCQVLIHVIGLGIVLLYAIRFL